MISCPTCGGPMKPLFTSTFCPRECDLRTTTAAPIVVEIKGRRWSVELVAAGEWPKPDGIWHGWFIGHEGRPTEGDLETFDGFYGGSTAPGWISSNDRPYFHENGGFIFRPLD